MCPGRVLEKNIPETFGTFAPRGDTKKKQTRKRTHIPGTHIHTTAAQPQHSSSSRYWSCRNPSAPKRRRSAPIKALTTTLTLAEDCAVLVKWRPRMRAHRRPLPRLLRRWYGADQSLALTLRALNWRVQWGRRGGNPTRQRQSSG